MRNAAIIDAGPCVALFNGRDIDHARVVDFLRNSSKRLVSTLAVVTEVMHVLDFSHEVQHEFLQWAFQGAIQFVDLQEDDFARILELHAKYGDLPIDFADATLIAIAERLEIRDVITLDSDFRIYRYRRRQHFRLLLLDD